MKLQVTQENLSKALNNVAKVATNRNTLPILANVMLITTKNRLSVIATNLDIAITNFIGSKVFKEGSITVPARLMQDFVNSLPSGVIDLELEDNKLHISTEKYKSTINGISAEDFPVMPSIQNGTTWKTPANVFKKGLQQVIIAASNDDARPVLTGVYIHNHEGKLYAVATDSYRLAEKILQDTKDDISLLVPANALQDLLRIISDSDEEITIKHDDQQVLFSVGDVQLVTRLIDGKYPDYRKLIPSSFQTSSTLSRPDFVNITKVSSLFAKESAGSITIKVSETEKQVSIRSIASQLGDNTATATAESKGEGDITLNSKYLLDALAVLGSETTSFLFNGKLEPCVIKDADNDDYTHIIMPLKS